MILRVILCAAVLFVVADAYALRTVEQSVKREIQRHRVMLFSKTYCPYSKRLKQLLRKYRIYGMSTIEIDQQRPEYQSIIQTMSGRRTVPQLFVSGRFIGGSDDTHELDRRGILKRILRDAGAIYE